MAYHSTKKAAITVRQVRQAALTAVAPDRFESWQDKLQRILDTHNDAALRKHKVISNKTKEERARTLFLCFRQLREGGYKLAEPENIKPKHIEYLMRRWESEGLSGSTLQCRLSTLNAFAEWIGKPGMIGTAAEYLVDPANAARTYVAKKDKSWTAAPDLNPAAIIAMVCAADPYVGMQLRVIQAFGLRRKEGVMFRPYRAHKTSDAGEYIELTATSGTKGGRPRVVPITTEQQRQVLIDAKALAGTPGNHIGNPQLTLKQQLSRFSNLLTKLGVTHKELGATAHGLRHQYLNDRYEVIAGVPSPVRGGTVTDDNRDACTLARLTTTEEAGHSRLQVTGAYYGSAAKTKL
jgi:integrase